MLEFPHQVIFQEPVKVKDEGGGYQKEVQWVSIFTTEANVQPLSGNRTRNEEYIADQFQSKINYNVFYPYQEGVQPNMRVLWGTRILEIKSEPIDQGGMGEILLLKCEEQ